MSSYSSIYTSSKNLRNSSIKGQLKTNFLYICEIFEKSWLSHPAFYYGCTFLLGIQATIKWFDALLYPLLFVGATTLSKPLRLLILILVFFTGFFFSSSHILLPNLPPKGIEGNAHIHLSFLSNKTSFRGKFWEYKGTLLSFKTSQEEVIAKRIPLTISIPYQWDHQRPLANTDYLIDGVLRQTSSGHYFLKLKKETKWYPIDNSWSLAEWRYQAKKFVKEYLKSHFKNPQSENFLIGIITGEFDNRLMSFEFSRFGLQHIMAISGFHFSILALFLNFFLQLILSKQQVIFVLLFLLTSYFIFLGNTPSVTRAWLCMIIALVGWLFQKKTQGLNTLGIALLILAIFDSLVIQNMGFQFSFLITTSILLYFPLFDSLLKRLFSNRSLEVMITEQRHTKIGYILLIFFRNAVALGLAVNLVALPLSLYYFQQFPLMALIYNLFFPFMVSFSIFLLIIQWHSFNDLYTSFILDYVYQLPRSFDYKLFVEQLNLSLLIFYFCTLLIFGIYFYQLKREFKSASLFANQLF